MDELRSGNGEGGGRPHPFTVVAFWAGVMLAENRGDTVTRAAEAFLFCARAGVSGLLAHDEWGGSSFPSEKAFSASRERGGMTATGAVAVRPCVTRTTVVCGVNVGRGWGAHQSGPDTEGG